MLYGFLVSLYGPEGSNVYVTSKTNLVRISVSVDQRRINYSSCSDPFIPLAVSSCLLQFSLVVIFINLFKCSTTHFDAWLSATQSESTTESFVRGTNDSVVESY